MALVAKPFGLAPIRTMDANEFTEQGTLYYIVSTDGNAYYIGDVVKSVAGGDANGVPGMVKDTVGTATERGVFVGAINPAPNQVSIQGVPLQLEYTAIPATKVVNYYILVVDDPSVMFAIQDDGITAGSLIAANCNKNFSLTIAAGTSNVSYSGTVMLSSSLATTQALNMRAVGLAQTIWQGQTNAFGGFGLWQCKFNQHELMGNTAGV